MVFSLSRSEESFKALFSFSPYARWIINNKTLEFLDVNIAATQDYGYSKEEFLNMRLDDLHLEEDLNHLYRLRDTRFKEPEAFSRDVIHITKSGKVVYKEIYSTRILFENIDARIGIISDKTESRKKENALSKYIAQLETIAFYNSQNLKNPISKLMKLVKDVSDTEPCVLKKDLKDGIMELAEMYQENNRNMVKLKDF